MTDPRDQDDGWAELNRELGVEDAASPKPARPPEPPAGEPPPGRVPPPEDEVLVELTAGAEADQGLVSGFDAVEATEEAIEEEYEPAEGEPAPSGAAGEAAAADGEPGQRKRRRRRRRRRKKGGAGQPGAEPAAAAASGAAGKEEDGFEAEAEPETPLEAEGPEPAGVEEVTPEMTRDIIANWNVPSWEEIVAGLYRPDR